MKKGISLATMIIEKSLDEDIEFEIASLLREISTYTYEKPTFNNELNSFISKLTEDQILTIKGYTGLESKKINAILRNNWNYEEHGLKTSDEEHKLYATEIAEKVKVGKELRQIYSLKILLQISGLPKSVYYYTLSKEDKDNKNKEIIDKIKDSYPKTKNAFIVYRGTPLDSLKKYGINTLEDIMHLKGKFMYEEGFTSTSIEEKESYFKKEVYGKINNIEIKYIIPPNSQDGIPLTTEELSYSTNQQEYLIERHSLSKVIDVEINDNTAVITALLIPKSIWNKNIKSSDKKEVKK